MVARKSGFYDVNVRVEGADPNLTAAQIKAYAATNVTVNTAAVVANFKYLELFITGKHKEPTVYNPIEVSYYYPRATHLTAGLITYGERKVGIERNETITPSVEETALVHQVGKGYDMKNLEFDNFNNYTNNLYYNQLSDGIPNPKLSYQFQESKNYDVLTLQHNYLKSSRNYGAGESNHAIVMIISENSGSNTTAAIHTSLMTALTPA